MSDNHYYLKIGDTEVFGKQLIGDISSADAETKKKAETSLADGLKEARVRVDTLLKTDNVSFAPRAGGVRKASAINIGDSVTRFQ